MKRKQQSFFQEKLLASLIGVAFAPSASWALDLAQSPPGTVERYVAPNVIISVDDSGSMGFRLDSETDVGATNATQPRADGTWPGTSRRMNVLQYAVKQVFNDQDLLADGKIRLAWQTLHNNGNNLANYPQYHYLYGNGRVRNPYQNRSPGADNVGSTAAGRTNFLRVLDSSHRANFLSFVDGLLPNNGTPSHEMVQQADAYLRAPLASGGPWATKPGGSASDPKSTEYLGCRRNYHIMMTDGRWNGTASGGQQDGGPALTLPDGTVYANTAQTRIYRDNQSDTLADWAFRSWADNLQPTLYDRSATEKQVPLTSAYRKAPPTENVGGVALQKYWNPEYNPATWPHMVTYTIGFSDSAFTWPGAPTIIRPTQMVPFGYDNSFPNFVNGTQTWPAMDNENRRALDLWHSAINGRGRFYAIQKGAELEQAFRQIVQQIGVDTLPERSSVGASGSVATRNDVGIYTANYDPTLAWKGWVTAASFTSSGASIAVPGWENKTTADRIDATLPNNRVILSWRDTNGVNLAQGVPFRWASDGSRLSPAHKATLQSTDGLGESRLNYIRGQRTNEGTGALAFRPRKSAQGDIVNSQVWYVGAPVSNYALKGYAAFTREQRNRVPMLYVGGNDGMLHGFSAVDGFEKIAYVPRGVIPSLIDLTKQDYDNNGHRYYVDGSPMTGDVDTAGATDPLGNYVPGWRTMLVGTLGGGGKGYFVLDVTNPGSTAPSGPANNFAESNAKDRVVIDRTIHAGESTPADCSTLPATAITSCIENQDIGNILAQPVLDDNNGLRTTQITRMNDNRWAVVMGNGYNSKNERPVLLIQYLDGNKELLLRPATGSAVPLKTDNTKDNGLSAPRLVDINSDGRPDIAYAGDNKGNMWKFDISSKLPGDWAVAFGGKPLFTALGINPGGGARAVPQPITAAPTVRANDRLKNVGVGANAKTVAVGGMMVAFGTGRNITRTDPESTAFQTIYGVLDSTRYRFIGTGDDRRVQAHPGCTGCDGGADIPAPTPLGEGVTIAKLAEQRIGTTAYVGQGASLDRTFWKVEQTAATDKPSVDWNTQNGWFLDLPQTGERLLKPMSFFDGSNILAAYTQVPAKGSTNVDNLSEESCKVTLVDTERQYLTLLNIMDGKRPEVQLMDRNGDGLFNGADNSVSRLTVSKGGQTLVTKGDFIINQGSGDRQDTLGRMPEEILRPSWRQLK